jgi:peptidoglycan/xylan/chitin deacetylase (PgdA/CDA1 family)
MAKRLNMGTLTAAEEIQRWIKAALRLALRASYASGALGALKRLGPANHRGLLILMYHSIGGSDLLHRGLRVSEKNFARQLEYLTRHFQIVPLVPAVKLMRRGEPVPEGAVALTFDDGFRDNYETALPLLKKYRCPATVFVATEPLTRRTSLWPYKLMYRVLRSQARRLEFSPGELPGIAPAVFDLETKRQRRGALNVIERMLWDVSRAERERLLGVIAEKLGMAPDSDPFDELPMLTWDQLREMAEAGIEIGSHTVSHPVLSALGREEALGELLDSKKLLAAELGRPVKVFAYPFGRPQHFTAESERLVRQAGYEAACTTVRGVNRSDTNPLRLLRIGVDDDPVEIFAFKLRFAGTLTAKIMRF